jgi:hypothetical protein
MASATAIGKRGPVHVTTCERAWEADLVVNMPAGDDD